MPTSGEVTRLLHLWSEGDLEALDQLIPLVYRDLHRLAHYFFQSESSTHTLQPSALVSEVYVRLRGQKEMDWDDRASFFGFAADVMRHFLVDYARRRTALKRGAGLPHVPLEKAARFAHLSESGLVELDEALEALEALDERQALVVKLRYFVGLKVPEVAKVLDISPTTVKREWRTAKFWLKNRLEPAGSID